jgi:hypothetical protein
VRNSVFALKWVQGEEMVKDKEIIRKDLVG